LGNGYRNARYGTKLEPSHPLGRLVAVAFPGFRQGVDTIYRYLPKRRDGAASRVLDIGSGSGDWLLVARAAGWHAVGSDPDPAARAAASASGLEVRKGGAEAWADQLGTFDAVSMNHVIEHVHQPLETLRTVFALLRPGGQLYIEAPNLDALGHLRFGRNWRGLEAPRHLVIFNRRGMSDTLRKAGFVNIRFRQQRSIFLHLSEVSARMEAGFEPYDENAPAMGAPALMDKIRARLTRTRAEFLTLTCIKPGEDDGERARG
jgi:SAM-dependent methyltransferase